MPRVKPAVPVSEMMAQVVAESPRLRKRLEKIIDLVLDDVEWTMEIGTVLDKAPFVRAVVPGMLRSLQESQSDAAASAQREAFDRVIAAVRGSDGKTTNGHR